MTVEDVGVGVVVRLSAEGRARRLWGPSTENTATVRDATLIDNFGKPCVRVSVDGERRSRTRTMWLGYLDVLADR